MRAPCSDRRLRPIVTNTNLLFAPHLRSALLPEPAPGDFYHSERQHGVFKMFARIVRPLWEGKLVKDVMVAEDGKQRCFVSVFDSLMWGRSPLVCSILSSTRHF